MCRGHSYCLAAVLFCLISPCLGETVYFLVTETEPANGDSYVLPLTEPNDIAHARDLITYGPSVGQPIVVATIACGSDCINRDYLGANKPAWYWHIAGFSYFSDTPVTGYQTPLSVNWDCNPSVAIACSLYTIVDELGTAPKHWKCDFDGDDDVDFNDYAPVANYWDNACTAPDWCGGVDFDHNGRVDCNDLGVFASAWLSPYASIPPGGGVEFPCWAWRYQCYGDADNKTEGLATKYRVYMSDSAILTAAQNTSYPESRYNPCADFNRDYRVNDGDAAILEAHWMKKDTHLQPPCPPKLICQP